MMKYKLVYKADRGLSSEVFDDTNVYREMEARGFPFKGLEANKGLRLELQNKPIFQGLVGPVWDGHVLRYETSEACELLGS